MILLGKMMCLGGREKVVCFPNASLCTLGQTESFVSKKCNQSFWSDMLQRETKTEVSRASAALMETGRNSA